MALMDAVLLLIAFLTGFLTLRGGILLLATAGFLISAASVTAAILAQYSGVSVLQITLLVVLAFNIGAGCAVARAVISGRGR